MKTYEVKIFIGSCRGYSKDKFSLENLVEAIQYYQYHCKEYCTVRTTPTEYIAADYRETGWEIAVINYPRFPKTEDFVWNWSVNLSQHLLKVFQQNRISIMDSDKTVIIESPMAQEHP